MRNSFYFDNGVVIVSDVEVNRFRKEIGEKMGRNFKSLSPIEIGVITGEIVPEFALALNKHLPRAIYKSNLSW